jgi:hypothetical protein
VENPSTDAGPRPDTLRGLGRDFLLFGLLLAAIWIALDRVDRAVPQLRPGASHIYAEKHRLIAEGGVFPTEAPVRVAIWGDSRVLAGFRPAQFDALAGESVQSYNLGFPATGEFVGALRRLVASGQTPTHVLMTQSWSHSTKSNWRLALEDDKGMMEALFPFRYLPRDLGNLRWNTFEGFDVLREQTQRNLDLVRADRGYFFIRSLALYPDERLPGDYSQPTDAPDTSWRRSCRPVGRQWEFLVSLAQDHGVRFVFVPTYYREGRFAPAEPSVWADSIAASGMQLLGPDYWLLPNRWFSDQVHLNPEGAEGYTRRLWELVGPTLLADAAELQKE